MTATIREIVDQAQEIIGEVAGVGVQEYGEDRLFIDTISGFNMLFKKYPWDQYVEWFRVEIDGTTGVPTTDAFERVKDFEDFIAVHRDGIDTPLPRKSLGMNPYAMTGNQTRPMFWGSLPVSHANYPKRRILVYPDTATGFINVCAKIYPLVPPAIEFNWDDVLYLDKDLLAYSAAFMTLVGDDLNAAAAETVKSFMDMRYNDITKALSNTPIPIRSRRGVPNEWYQRP